jgi:hypothetical protein
MYFCVEDWKQIHRDVLEHRHTFLLEAFVSESCSHYLRGRILMFLECTQGLSPVTDKALVARAREVRDSFYRRLGFSNDDGERVPSWRS